MKHALIVGISGQDGAYLARLLLAADYRVSGTSRTPSGVPPANLVAVGITDQVRLHALDIEDLAAVTALLEQQNPDEIYHLAGQSSVGLSLVRPRETFAANAIGVVNLLEAVRCLRLPARICLASSAECFGDTGGLPTNEQTPMRPRSPYGVAKAAAFWQGVAYRDNYGLFVASAILYNHESPLRPPNFVTAKIIKGVAAIAACRASRLTLGNLDIVRDWGWAEEYVRALPLMLQHSKPEDFVIASGSSFTLREFVARAFALRGMNWREYYDCDTGLWRPSDIPICRADPAKAADLLGWRATITMPGVVERLLGETGETPVLRRG